MSHRVLSAAFFCLAVFAVCAPAASAEPLAPAAISPASGTTLTPGAPITFKVTSPSASFANFRVIVASHPALNPDGELTSPVLENIELHAAVGEPGVYEGVSLYPSHEAGWSFTPGAYYWQVGAVYDEVTSTPPFIHASEQLSPAYTLTIAPLASSLPSGAPSQTPSPDAPAPAPAAALFGAALVQANARVRRAIEHSTGHSAVHLKDTCISSAVAIVSCRATWLSGPQRSAATERYAGVFRLVTERGGLTVSFVGHRSRLGCDRSHGTRRCESTIRW